MGRPRIATAIHELKGTGRKHPERMRERENEPMPTGPLGAAPAHFDDDEVAMWAEISGILPYGVAGDSDRLIVEMLCRVMLQLRDTPRGQLDPPLLGKFQSLVGALGMTPADRSKVKAMKAPVQNAFAA